MEPTRRSVSDQDLGRTDFPRDWWGRMGARRSRLRAAWLRPWVQALAMATLVLAFGLVYGTSGWTLWVGVVLWAVVLAAHLWLLPPRRRFWHGQ
jgi:hypothetical protein